MKDKKSKKAFVAMSGGVDSSVAAALLKQRGFDVVGVYMKCYNVDGCGTRDAEDARRAAETLKIPFYVWDFEKEYKDKVVKYMVDGYRKGITPNPDVMCNKEIKFGLFLKKALAMGADYVATGHYVRLREWNVARKNLVASTRFARPATRSLVLAASPLGSKKIKRADHAEAAPGVSANKIFSLYSAKDANKDQSYFLWTLTQNQLKHCLFPIGDYLKPEVRKLAKKFGLPNAEKKDSQGICFLGKVTLKDFLKNYLPEKKGIVLDTGGRIVGEHNGAHFYTIGQRHFGVKLQASSFKLQASSFKRQASSVKRQASRIKNQNRKPYYIAEKDVKENAILVAEGNNPAFYQKEIALKNINFLAPITNYQLPITVYARVRYRQPLAQATLHKLQATSYKLIFGRAQKFIAPGQSAVFYLPVKASAKEGGLEVLGGGVIV